MTDHDALRLRTTKRVVVAGPLLGVLAAAGTAAIGGGGRLGLLVLLLCCAAACVAAAGVTLVHAAVDEAKRRPVALRRIGWAGGLVLVSLMLIVFIGGIAAGAGGW